MKKLLSALLVPFLVSPPLPARDLAGDLTLLHLLVDGESWQLAAEGLGFADGPCSDAEGNFYFSDMRAPTIDRISIAGVRTPLLPEPASGLKFGPDGRLYACQGSKKRIIAFRPGETEIEVIASGVQPNDLVISNRGHLYFTETGIKQITLVDLANKTVRAVDVGITAPNGITLSPDQGTLAVSDHRGAHVWFFRIEEDGSLSGRTPYASMRRPIDPDAPSRHNEPPPLKEASGGDGMISDESGRFYVATTLGVQIFDPTGRECGLLPKPHPDKPLTSCTLAGPGRSFLYITHGNRIYRRPVKAAGSFFMR